MNSDFMSSRGGITIKRVVHITEHLSFGDDVPHLNLYGPIYTGQMHFAVNGCRARFGVKS